ncbi:MAG: BREX-2 system adenine-specific DNA-methyltransferase PglX, partial [Pseudonocardia sp.]|nr:BREX-2 system adenine-specific DNA-methyltransferase PglX [Pseudonocardia sp.]
LKQVSQGKGGSGLGRGLQDEDWEERYEFTGTKLQEFPLPADLPLDLGRELDRLAQLLAAEEPAAVCERTTPTRDHLAAARIEHEHLRRRMIALQEELDWQVYGSYALITETETKNLLADSWVEPLALGERAFEIVLARKVKAGEMESAWFDRHGSTPITEIPSHWSPEYQKIVQARIDIIENRRDIALIERPECKRRWASPTWEKKEGEALQGWLLDRCEQPDLWFTLRDGMRQPRPLTVSQLADRLSEDSDVQAVAQLYATDHLGKRDLPLARILETVVADEHVPYLAALRYKDSGLVKRAEWEQTWDLQRDEDRTGRNLHIAVPPKYKPVDFRKVSYWAQRGKLDVPKERFVSYPGASPDADPTLLLGWAGWDHKDQAQALVNLVNDRASLAGWDTDRLTPLLAGLCEVLPWVHQWHGEYDADWDGIPAQEYQAYLDEQRTKRELTVDGLRAWRPAAATRGRTPKDAT